jgi:DNA modification methylase
MKDKLSLVTKEIAKRAEENSLDLNYESPFYKKAIQHGKNFRKGGKPDDITVIIAQILEEDGQIKTTQAAASLEGSNGMELRLV